LRRATHPARRPVETAASVDKLRDGGLATGEGLGAQLDHRCWEKRASGPSEADEALARAFPQSPPARRRI